MLKICTFLRNNQSHFPISKRKNANSSCILSVC
nr:MAG TPA: hypothetical protein [Inoviridae sp.]